MLDPSTAIEPGHVPGLQKTSLFFVINKPRGSALSPTIPPFFQAASCLLVCAASGQTKCPPEESGLESIPVTSIPKTERNPSKTFSVSNRKLKGRGDAKMALPILSTKR